MLAFLISFLVTALVTPGVIALAWRRGWVARPRPDRWHSHPTALMGGIAIVLGTAAAWLFCGSWSTLAPVAAAAAAMFLLGLADDSLIELRPHHKLIGQVAVASGLIAAGIHFDGGYPLLALPLTLVWIVGITNAVNLLDNMDGLAAGVVGICALALAAYGVTDGRPGTAPGMSEAGLALAGACAGFLIYNFQPAKIFMGDCGSMFLGCSLATLAIQAGTRSGLGPIPAPRSVPNLLLALLVPFTVLAIPIFDTTLVAVERALHGRPILPGYRDHSSHRMVGLGLSERRAVLILYALTALFGALALFATRLSLVAVTVLALLLFSGLMLLGLYLGFLKVYPEESRVPQDTRILPGRLFDKRYVLQVLLDIPLVMVAFVGAHLLRFEGHLTPFFEKSILIALPAVLVAKLLGLALCRAYRGIWRYAGMADAWTAIAGSAAGSLLTAGIVAIYPGFGAISRAALIMDWLLFSGFAVVTRLGYAALRELFAMLAPRTGPRVLILGAGEEAFALVQKLRDPLSPHRAAVIGILDDDPEVLGRTLDGVPVVGPLSRLPALLEEKTIDCCLLGVPALSPAGASILARCHAAHIRITPDLPSAYLNGHGNGAEEAISDQRSAISDGLLQKQDIQDRQDRAPDAAAGSVRLEGLNA